MMNFTNCQERPTMVFKPIDWVVVKAIPIDSPTTTDTEDTVIMNDQSHSDHGSGQDDHHEEDQSEEGGHDQQPLPDAKDDADDSDSDQDSQGRSAMEVRRKKKDSDDGDGNLGNDVTGAHSEEADVSRFRRFSLGMLCVLC